MNTKALKQKILDLAIHGKLLPLEKVEKIRKEEPASVLLEKIRAEKQEKIAKGELKKDKNDSFIFVGDDKRHYEKFADGSVKDIEDEIPFYVLDGWSWCRLKEISLDMADGPFGSNLKTEHYTTKKEARLIQLSNIGEEGWREENTKYTTFEHAKKNISRSIVESGNIVIAKMMPAGRAIICPNNEKMYVLSSDAVKLIPSILIYSKYLLNTINSPSFRNSVTDNVQGSTRLRTSISKLKECFIPLPPLAEQQLIVAEIEKIFAQIDLLEQNKTDLQTAIKQAKSKILDLAIHGKLVSQDPNDESASGLLEKIRAEKEEKIAKGELKRDKNDSYIYKGSDNCHYEKFTDGTEEEIEVPFDLPEGWNWGRLNDVSLIFTGNSINENEKTTKYSNIKEGYFYIATKDIDFDRKINYDNGIKIPFNETKFKMAPTNSVLLCIEGGSAGRKIGLTNRDVCFVNKLCCLHSNTIDNSFMYFYLQSSTFIDLFNENKSGLIGGVSLNNIKELYIPIPPLNEQVRIVNKITELFSILDKISLNLV